MPEPAFPNRAVMLDIVRLPERHDYYRSLLPMFEEWGFNTLHLHFTDDPGCLIEFPSHPELATEHAYPADEMRAFVDEAHAHGLDVVPELETFGHTEFITDTQKYCHLKEIDETGGRFRGMCVFEQEAKDLLADLLRDVADIFRPRIIHAGLDEVNFGWHDTTKKLLETRPRNELFADHVVWCHDVIAGLGARMGMWDDGPVADKEGVIARRIPKDTIIFVCMYAADCEPGWLDFYLDCGLEVWAVPSIQRAGNAVMSNRESLSSLRRASGYALQRRESAPPRGRVTGVDACVWCPYRYVPGTIEYPLAVAGRLFSSDELVPDDFAAGFAKFMWGLRSAAARKVGRAVEALYEAAPSRDEHHRFLYGHTCFKPAETFCREDRRVCRERLATVEDAGRALAGAVGAAKRNADRLRDLVTAAKYLRAVYRFGAGAQAGRREFRGVQRAMQGAWGRTRFREGRHYFGKSAMPPAERDYDDIMPQVNRLASE